jgi:hypothetical protein
LFLVRGACQGTPHRHHSSIVRELRRARGAPRAVMRSRLPRMHLSRTGDLDSRSLVRKIRCSLSPDGKTRKRRRAAWFPWRPVHARRWRRQSCEGPPGRVVPLASVSKETKSAACMQT